MAKFTRFLFKWQEIEAKSDLSRLMLVLQHIPDESLMKKLEQRRGKGRNEYPIRPMWNALLAGIIYQHKSIESLRRELLRNAELRHVCGFDPFRGSDAVPPPEAFTRFSRNLVVCKDEIDQIFDQLLEKLQVELKDLGERMAIDSKAIASFGKPSKSEKKDGRRDVDANWGVKEYKGKRMDGTEWKTKKKWFGYKVHLLVDTTYEIPLSYEVTKASEYDGNQMQPLITKHHDRHSKLSERMRYLYADKAYDDTKDIAWLYDTYGIMPVIDIRNCWKKEGDEAERKDNEPNCRQLYPYTTDNIVYDYRGNVYCICLKTLKNQAMAYGGYEKDRQSLKYICPVKAYGMTCQRMSECKHREKSIRIHLTKDRRVFTPMARSSYAWAREYKHRTAVERVNSRLDVNYGFEQHTIRGLTKMKMRVGMAFIVMLSMALGHIKEKRNELMRSLIKRPDQAVRKKAA